jgi:predicted nucleic acid-binding protein
LDQGVGTRRWIVHGHERAQRLQQGLRRKTAARVTRFVTADASPLIGLATVGALHLLRDLFGTVTITRLVKDEVTGHRDRPGAAEIDAAMREGWLRVAPAPLATWRLTKIDAGEASTIALAAEHPGSLVLMDDTVGREQASALGLELLDLAGVLLAAKRARVIEAVQPLVAQLVRRGFTMSADARGALLRAAGELDVLR